MNDQMFESRAALSAAGDARRREILALGQAALRGRVRRRFAARAGLAAAAPALLVASLLWAGWPAGGSGGGTRVVVEAPRDVLPPAPAGPLIERIPTDTGAAARLRLATRAAPPGFYIDDPGLESLLAEAGERGGLIRIDGRVLLESELVAEAPPDPDAPAWPG